MSIAKQEVKQESKQESKQQETKQEVKQETAGALFPANPVNENTREITPSTPTATATTTAINQPTALTTFNLPILTAKEQALQVVSENLDGLGEFRFDKIDMPSGKAISFTLEDENGEPTPIKELKGIILDKYPFKVWYVKAYEEKGPDDTGMPDCYSADNVHGSGCEEAGIPKGQLCAECPKGQWSSNRRGGKGKDCADKIRLHILMEGDVFPHYIDAPPASLANFKDYVKRLANKLFPFYGVVTVIGLERAKRDGGLDYNKMTFRKAAELTMAERKAIKEYINTLMPSMRNITQENIGEQRVDVEGMEDVDVDVDDVNGVGVSGGGSATQAY